jgi:hypothetical protein
MWLHLDHASKIAHAGGSRPAVSTAAKLINGSSDFASTSPSCADLPKPFLRAYFLQNIRTLYV